MKKSKKIILSTSLISSGIIATSAVSSILVMNKNKQEANHDTNEYNNQNSSNSLLKTTNNNSINTNFLPPVFKNEKIVLNSNEFVQNNIIYSIINNTNDLKIMGFYHQNKNPNLVINSYILHDDNYYKVVSIADSSFYNCNLSSVVFPNTLLSIGSLAFANNNISQLNFPNNLQKIGNQAFIANTFSQGTVIYLPANTTWNKNWGLSPFGNSNNFSKLIDMVQYVIQDGMVYQFTPDQLAWIPVSVQPNVINNIKTKYTIKKLTNAYNKLVPNPTSNQAPYNPLRNINTQAYFPSNNLNNYGIVIRNGGSDVTGVIKFDSKTMKLVVDKNNWNTLLFKRPGWEFSNNHNVILKIVIYNPTTQKTNIYEFNKNSRVSNLYVELNNKSFNYNDIIGINITDMFAHLWCGFTSNINNSMNSNLNDLNRYMGLNYSWDHYHGRMSYFTIKESGIYFTPSITVVNPIKILGNDLNKNHEHPIDISGTSLANRKVEIIIGNKLKYETTTNSEGIFSIKKWINTNLFNSYNFTSNTEVVIYVQNANPVYTHLLGNNPSDSYINFNFAGVNGSVIFNGITNKWEYYTGGINFPSFENTYGTFNNSNATSKLRFRYAKKTIDTGKNKKIITSSINYVLYVTINNTTYTFKAKSNDPFQNFINWINKLPFNGNDQIVFSVPSNDNDLQMIEARSNSLIIQYGYIHQKFDNKNMISYGFNVNASGISSLYSKHLSGYGYNFNPQKWVIGDGCIITGQGGSDGALITDFQKKNWYNPSFRMKEVVAQLTTGYASDFAKALAIENWVAQNVHYTSKYAYGHTLRGNFEHLEGVCAQYANLACGMLKLAGIVSRIVIGECYNPGLKRQWWSIDHAWTQSWIPSLGEWLTLDPCWDWFGPYGDLQSQFNIDRANMHICLVEWPDNTSYFSYFTNHEYEALQNLGRFFNIAPGRKLSSQFAYSTGAWIVKALQKGANVLPNHYFVSYKSK